MRNDKISADDQEGIELIGLACVKFLSVSLVSIYIDNKVEEKV
jgi:hypothetical protein